MTRDDIIRMAREAGYQHPDACGQCEDFAYFDLERFAQLVAAAEREHCAARAAIALLGTLKTTSDRVLHAIRARGQQ